jgi:hypothetical protein
MIGQLKKGVAARTSVCSVETLEPRRLLAGLTVDVPTGHDQ